jgi:hypothetical protein
MIQRGYAGVKRRHIPIMYRKYTAEVSDWIGEEDKRGY